MIIYLFVVVLKGIWYLLIRKNIHDIKEKKNKQHSCDVVEQEKRITAFQYEIEYVFFNWKNPIVFFFSVSNNVDFRMMLSWVRFFFFAFGLCN